MATIVSREVRAGATEVQILRNSEAAPSRTTSRCESCPRDWSIHPGNRLDLGRGNESHASSSDKALAACCCAGATSRASEREGRNRRKCLQRRK